MAGENPPADQADDNATQETKQKNRDLSPVQKFVGVIATKRAPDNEYARLHAGACSLERVAGIAVPTMHRSLSKRKNSVVGAARKTCKDKPPSSATNSEEAAQSLAERRSGLKDKLTNVEFCSEPIPRVVPPSDRGLAAAMAAWHRRRERQLPNNGPDTTPVASKGWPWLREAQSMALREPRTAMAVAIDVGDPGNVHPASKGDVGHRLALAARKIAYGEDLVASGPTYESFEAARDGQVRVRFGEVGGGLAIGQSPWYAAGVEPYPKDKPIGFFITGEDLKWVEADARIDGNAVLAGSPAVAKPVAVRYGWANSPRCNLYNRQ